MVNIRDAFEKHRRMAQFYGEFEELLIKSSVVIERETTKKLPDLAVNVRELVSFSRIVAEYRSTA